MRGLQERRAVAALNPARGRLALGAVVLACSLLADALTKVWAERTLGDGRVIELVGPLRLRLTHNTGIAFGIGSGRSPIFVVVGLVVTAGLVWIAGQATTRAQAVGFGFILAGALGNLGDRILGGSVTDFIDPQWWPVFNVADISLFMGAALLVVASFVQRDDDA